MRANSGGGGGAALGYMFAKDPVGTSVIVGGLFAVVAAGVGVYTVMDNNDRPNRDPLATNIIENSSAVCGNAPGNPALYETDLKDGLMKVWSNDLKNFTPETMAQPVCAEPALHNFEMRYHFKEQSDNDVHIGSHRVAGLVFTQAGGAQAFVVKPFAKDNVADSLDNRPDDPADLKTVLAAMKIMPKDAYQTTLADGTRVAAFLQRDGIIDPQYGKEKDHDGTLWANETQMGEVLTHFQPVWPVKAHVRLEVPQDLPTPPRMSSP